MVVAPGAGRVEVAGPDAEASIAGGGFLGPVAAHGNGKALGDHGGAEIAAINAAGGKKATILIGVFGATIGGAGGQELGHAVAGRAAAGPGFPAIGSAVLRQFRRVEAEQANAIIAQAKAVAIAGAGEAGNWRRRAIQSGSDQRQHGQNRYGQEGSARAAKDGIASASWLQDFTAR